jgi:hypothetical protein
VASGVRRRAPGCGGRSPRHARRRGPRDHRRGDAPRTVAAQGRRATARRPGGAGGRAVRQRSTACGARAALPPARRRRRRDRGVTPAARARRGRRAAAAGPIAQPGGAALPRPPPGLAGRPPRADGLGGFGPGRPPQDLEGVFPPVLARKGLVSALRAHLGSAGHSLEVDGTAEGRRFDGRVEAAAYFCCVEAVCDLSAPAAVRLVVRGDTLQLSVEGRASRGARARGGPAARQRPPARRCAARSRCRATTRTSGSWRRSR